MNDYKIEISIGDRYYEAILDQKVTKRVTIGSSAECDIKFKSMVPFDISLEYADNEWNVYCSENIYFLTRGLSKMTSRALKHGDELRFKSEIDDKLILSLAFTFNFEYEKKRYNYSIDISNRNSITFGRDVNYDVYLKDELLGTDRFEIVHTEGKYVLHDYNSKYGASVNTLKIRGEKELHNYDFFFILDYAFYFKDGILYTDLSDNEKIEIKKLKSEKILEQNSTLTYPKFNRNTRIKTVLSESVIEVLDPDKVPEEPHKNILLTLLPTVGMMAITMVMRAALYNRGKQMLILGATMVGIGILTSVISFVNEKKSYKERVEKRERVYNDYIADKRTEIEKKREEELQALNQKYFSLSNEIKMVEDFSADLFNRDITDDDFLDVRLGTGRVKAKAVIKIRDKATLETKDELAIIPRQIADEFEYINKAPVVVPLSSINALGVVGREDYRIAMFRNIVVDLVVRQHYSTVKLFFMFDSEKSQFIRWARYLPHISNDMFNARNIVCDDESKTLHFDYLYKILSAREVSDDKFPWLVIMIFDSVGLRKHPISGFIDKANELGAVFVFFEELEEMLPKGCDKIVKLVKEENRGVLLDVMDANISSEFSYDAISPIDAENIAMKLAPIYAEEVSLDNTLTKNITLFDLLNINNSSSMLIDENWRQSDVCKSMTVPLGINAKNEIVSLDIHEKYHGPHGLVAGTTGSGKSEILQSYVLSMALKYHPYDVSFVIIDFKGGGMANQFAQLPHLVGAITNIDDREITRSLLSIKAELKKRQRLFAEADVNHIDAYITKVKNHEVNIALPHMIIIVDEFAELKADQPDFMKELISAARIGRSLGVHLILATQKPSGVVDDQIWSNSKFKLCLKVQNKQDSNDVIKSPLASEIREPGRAYFQVGNNEIFELFQSAYSGAPVESFADDIREFDVYELSLSGKHRLIFSQKKNGGNNTAKTQLECIVDSVQKYAKIMKIAKLPPICLPPLEENLVSDRNAFDGSAKAYFPLGIYDDPENQYQGVYNVSFSVGNIWIIGSSQMGKTNILQNIIAYSAYNYSPDQLMIYIADYASGILNQFANLNHVGAVLLPNEDEKTKNLFRILQDEIDKRKKKISGKGMSSFASYLEAGFTDLRQILFIIDNIPAFKEVYSEDSELLLRIIREGSAVGICTIVTAVQSNGFGYKYLANFSTRIVLTCTDETEYSAMFSATRKRPKPVPGRALIKLNRNLYECQCYQAFEGEREIDRAVGISELITTCNTKYAGISAPRMAVLPEVYLKSMVSEYSRFDHSNDYCVDIGLDYDEVSPFTFDLKKIGILAISGEDRFGKTNIIRVILDSLEEKNEDVKVEVYISDFITRDLFSYSSSARVKCYATTVEDACDFIRAVEHEMASRLERSSNVEVGRISDTPVQVLLFSNPDIFKAIADNKETAEAFRNLAGKYKSLGVCMIFDCVPNEPIPYNAGDVLKWFKDNTNILIFENFESFKMTTVSAAIRRRYTKHLVPGECYYVKGSEIVKVKTLLSPNSIVGDD